MSGSTPSNLDEATGSWHVAAVLAHISRSRGAALSDLIAEDGGEGQHRLLGEGRAARRLADCSAVPA